MRGWYSARGILLSRRSLHLLTAQRTARALVGRLAVGPYWSTVDKDVPYADGGSHRHLKSRPIGDGLGVKDSNVGTGSFSQCSTVG